MPFFASGLMILPMTFRYIVEVTWTFAFRFMPNHILAWAKAHATGTFAEHPSIRSGFSPSHFGEDDGLGAYPTGQTVLTIHLSSALVVHAPLLAVGISHEMNRSLLICCISTNSWLRCSVLSRLDHHSMNHTPVGQGFATDRSFHRTDDDATLAGWELFSAVRLRLDSQHDG